jgi:hypothetical protein
VHLWKVPHAALGVRPKLRRNGGALILSEVRVPVLTVICEPCGRRERYDVERLTRQYGWDAKLTDLLPALVVDCPKRGSISVYDRCKAVFERRG